MTTSEPQEEEKSTDDQNYFDIVKQLTASSKVKAAHEAVKHLKFYWSSLVDDDIAKILTKQGQCILIDDEIHPTGDSRYEFCVRIQESNPIAKYKVKTVKGVLMVTSAKEKLQTYIFRNKLQPISRKSFWDPDKLSPETPPDKFDGMFQMGKLGKRNLQVLDEVTVPVLTLTYNFSEDEIEVVVADLHKYMDFGNRHVLRLWGGTITNRVTSILFESTAVGTLPEHLPSLDRDCFPRLVKEIYSALYYFECMMFTHKKLSPQVCLLTEKLQIKIALFGLSSGVIPKRIYATDVDRCRWLPPEVIADPQSEYLNIGMVWTFGTMVWSMFHEGALPFENEVPDSIMSTEFRKTAEFPIEPSVFPDSLVELTKECWSEYINRPSFFKLRPLINKI